MALSKPHAPPMRAEGRNRHRRVLPPRSEPEGGGSGTEDAESWNPIPTTAISLGSMSPWHVHFGCRRRAPDFSETGEPVVVVWCCDDSASMRVGLLAHMGLGIFCSGVLLGWPVRDQMGQFDPFFICPSKFKFQKPTHLLILVTQT